jgi:hypothetical protein
VCVLEEESALCVGHGKEYGDTERLCVYVVYIVRECEYLYV